MKELNLATSNHFEIECFQSEMNIISQLPPHPNIVQFLHSQEEKQNLQIFMTQYSSTLREYLNQIRDEFSLETSSRDNGRYPAEDKNVKPLSSSRKSFATEPSSDSDSIDSPISKGHPSGRSSSSETKLPPDPNKIIVPIEHYLTAVEAAEVAIEVAQGIRHLHQNCVMHRDIKSSNVFVVQDPCRKILNSSIGDFDTAKKFPMRYLSDDHHRGKKIDRIADHTVIGSLSHHPCHPLILLHLLTFTS